MLKWWNLRLNGIYNFRYINFVKSILAHYKKRLLLNWLITESIWKFDLRINNMLSAFLYVMIAVIIYQLLISSIGLV